MLVSLHRLCYLRRYSQKMGNFFISYLILSFALFLYGTVVGQQLGKECQVSSSISGTCKRATNCPSVITKIHQKEPYERCGFEDKEEIVCCPDELAKKTENSTISQRKCREYAEFVFEYPASSVPSEKPKVDKCAEGGTPPMSIGDNAYPREFPHMALIGYEKNHSFVWLCSGSLISEQYVLTVAHCLSARQSSEPKFVLLGELNTESENEDAKPERFGISSLILHPDNKFPSKYDDIGLIKLDKKVELSPYIRPACLPTVFDEPGTRAIVSGWGLVDRTKITPGPQHLMKQVLEKFSHEECNATYGSQTNRRLRDGIRDQTQLCFGSRTDDRCISESGSPLQVYHKDLYCMQTIIGVTSFGPVCTTRNLPDVFTRVYSYVDWIESIVWRDE